MPHLSDIHKRHLIDVAGILYALSLHKYATRDALSTQTGVQGPLEFVLISTAFLCSLIAVRQAPRRYAASPVMLCFAAYGIFALASSWRSFNAPLSLTKGLLLFGVLGIGYVTSQSGFANRFFQSIYWSYVATLAVGLILGLALPGRFPIWSIDDFTGRTRLSVFSTFPGTMGETAAYLVLLAPILFRRSHWVSRLFLLLMNLAAGGKTSTAILLVLLAIEYVSKIRTGRSWRVVALAGGLCLGTCAALYVGLSSNSGVDQLRGKSLDIIYGHDVSGEAMSLDGRLDLWKGSFALLLDSPMLGYGFDGAREVMMSIAAWSGSSHNGFLELGLAGGIFGLGIFVIGLAGVFRAAWNSDTHLRWQALFVLAYMIAIALTGITFNFPSYFGLLILVLVTYRSSQPNPLLSSAGATWTEETLVADEEDLPCRA